MSNFLAIATVTETLRQVLQAAADNDLPGTTVTMARPENQGNGPSASRINVFLYQVTPNAALRNADLPTRSSSATIQRRPQAAIDLHYLFSVSGDDAQLEPQRLLGTVVKTLHGRPMLTRQMIADALGNTTFGFLANSDLGDQVELVKLAPSVLSLEELSNLWSVFFQTPFVLSVAYDATVLLIEEDETPMTPLPVEERRLRVLPFRQPHIERIRSTTNPDGPIVAGDTIEVLGRRLQGDVTRLRISGRVLTPASVTDERITVALTAPPMAATALRAGVHGVQVVQQILFDTPADPHRGFESNVAPFVLQPTLTNPGVAGGVVQVNVTPPIRAGQRVSLLLNQTTTNDPAAHAFAMPAAPADIAQVQVQTNSVAIGQYFVRLQVDGADSPLDLDPASPTFGPTVTFP
jgi:hypothetical protein